MNYKERFVVLDIETTGLNFEYFDEPTEIALIEVIDGKLTGNDRHYYLKPRKAINLSFLQKVFGKNFIKAMNSKDFLSAKKVFEKKKESYSEEEQESFLKEILHIEEMSKNMFDNISKGKNKYKILPEVRDFIGNSIVVGHNVKFDVNFLNYWFNSMKLPLIQNYICTMESFKRYFSSKTYNLGYCCEHYDISLDGAHNALEDTRACAYLFLKEINEFPDEIVYFENSKIESYCGFKKRVLKSTYGQFANLILSDSCDIPKNVESLGAIEIDACKNLFFKFKKPIEVSKMTGLDLGSVEYIFLDWVNCININKHQDLLKDKYLKETIEEILNICEGDEDLEKCSKLLFDASPNYFYFRLVDKIENRKENMEYDLNDFDFYFVNLRDLDSLAEKIGKDIEYIYHFLILWINNDNTRFLKYKQFLKENYKQNGNIKQQKLYKVINNSLTKQYILKQLGF